MKDYLIKQLEDEIERIWKHIESNEPEVEAD